MPARTNSFHLLLSDDELELLRLLAEREGLNASDYLRTMLRRLASPTPHMGVAGVMRLGEILGAPELAKIVETYGASTKRKKSK
ncbi:MAG TPA: hypothetical protein VF316_12770 [Polyangiaceae bacterium]